MQYDIKYIQSTLILRIIVLNHTVKLVTDFGVTNCLGQFREIRGIRSRMYSEDLLW